MQEQGPSRLEPEIRGKTSTDLFESSSAHRDEPAGIALTDDRAQGLGAPPRYRVGPAAGAHGGTPSGSRVHSTCSQSRSGPWSITWKSLGRIDERSYESSSPSHLAVVKRSLRAVR